MTYSAFDRSRNELEVEREQQRDEELSLHTPSELGKQGPDFVEVHQRWLLKP